MTEKIDKKNDSLFPFQTYTFRNTTELETMCPNAFDMMLNPEYEHELWIGNINGLVSPTSEYGLAIKLKGYIIAEKKLTFILPENYEAIRPDNGNIGFRKTVLDMIRLGDSKGLIEIYPYSIEHAEDDINKILKEFKDSDMKFDVAIMNPPYDGNLHLKILEKVIPVADKVVNISPIRWLQDPLAKYKKNSDYKKFENSISKKIDDITFISTEESNKLFNILLLQPLAIYTISNGGYNYDFCTPLLKKIFDKILLENNFSKLKISNYNDNLVNFVLINKMAPPMKYGKPMFDALKTWCGYFTNKVNKKGETYQMAKDNCKASVRGDINKDIAIVFTTDKETINCYNAFCTKFARFCCMKSVVDIHVHQKFLPYMPDYTQPWTDKRFCEYFGITGYIDDEHAEPGSEWETILKTMEQYK